MIATQTGPHSYPPRGKPGFIVAILATSLAACVHPYRLAIRGTMLPSCEVAQVEVARGARETYIRPDRREAVAEALIHELLVPVALGKASAEFDRNCEYLPDSIARVVGREALSRAYSEVSKRAPVSNSRILQAWERLATDPRASEDLREDLPQLSLLMSAPECAAIQEEAQRILEGLSQKSDRISRLDAALQMARGPMFRRCDPDSPEDSVERLVETPGSLAGTWAAHQITLSRDPRQWSPVEVAHLISAGLKGTPALFALSRMGFRRASTLTTPPGAVPLFPSVAGDPALQYAWVLDNGPDSGPLAHFDGERSLYEHEWSRLHAASTMPSDHESLLSLSRYIAEQWIATDDAAPQPQMAMVNAELRRLRAADAAK